MHWRASPAKRTFCQVVPFRSTPTRNRNPPKRVLSFFLQTRFRTKLKISFLARTNSFEHELHCLVHRSSCEVVFFWLPRCPWKIFQVHVPAWHANMIETLVPHLGGPKTCICAAAAKKRRHMLLVDSSIFRSLWRTHVGFYSVFALKNSDALEHYDANSKASLSIRWATGPA
jgi:hypothetical protein